MLASVIARFRDGRVAEVWEAPTDPVALEEFWA
jgi:ketosteroid isomerase-like protein